MSRTQPDLQPFIDQFIMPGIREAINQEVEAITEQAVARLRNLIPQIVAGCGIHIAEMVSAERWGRDIRITITMPKEK